MLQPTSQMVYLQCLKRQTPSQAWYGTKLGVYI